MSENILSADNQQGRLQINIGEPSETIRRTPFKFFSENEVYAYLQGAMHDGSLNKNKRIRFGQKYPEWLNTLKNLMMSVGVNSWIYKEGKNREFYILETVCKNLSLSFDPSTLKTSKEKIAYIKEFFDAEGGVPRNNDKLYIQLVQKDFHKMEILRQMLEELGISTGKLHNPSKKVDPNYWRFFISTKDHKKFAEIIGSFHPIKAKIFSQRMMI